MNPKSALEKLKNSKLFADLEENCEVLIKEFFLGYYALPAMEAQSFLFPVYVARGQVTTPYFRSEFTRYLLAVSLDDLKKAAVSTDSNIFPDPDLL